MNKKHKSGLDYYHTVPGPVFLVNIRLGAGERTLKRCVIIIHGNVYISHNLYIRLWIFAIVAGTGTMV